MLSTEQRSTEHGAPDYTPVSGADADTPRQQQQQQPTIQRQTADLTPDMYNRLAVEFERRMREDRRKSFGCATLIALAGFLLSLSPLACDLMGWRGAGGFGAASIGTFFFQGGVMMIIGAVLEWVLGNSFFAVVFATYGGFWLSYAATLNPSFAAFASYAAPDAKSPAEGLASPAFQSSLAFWLLFMGFITFIFFICSLAMSVVFMVLFLSLTITFLLLVGALFALSNDPVGNMRVANRCIVGAGSSLFVTAMSGWYVFASILFAILGFPIKLPLLEIPHRKKGGDDIEG
ncbi:hypothetical protein XA68_12331 [Ophiocordyceps unilateralis]|uniref:GPR1/FUN34/YaaH-class plasma membrane protein n=1 Tax=Ophiocordyceps unilateralis TaxID=268505 RepID=A0A2A9PV59_OPHUN|nr:hypothetical protein XA68_12331 [Ophiocordyceps unilateralis]